MANREFQDIPLARNITGRKAFQLDLPTIVRVHATRMTNRAGPFPRSSGESGIRSVGESKSDDSTS
jgi:hypothetical protein